MSTMALCPSCGKPLAPDAPKGLCQQCLLKAGFPSGTGTDAGESRTSFVPPSAAELGAKFPQLEILELLGRGGMGAVYKARQKQLGRLVALKILPPGMGDESDFAERFAREARALAAMNHPGIVTLYEFGQANGLFFFLMEFVDGVNLRQLLNSGRIAPREALAIVPQICDALQYAHDQGIVHRDIKPENILLDRKGRVKVADFGLARLMGAEVEATSVSSESATAALSLTEAGKVMGTPQYMAPEQKDKPGEVDHRADIYSLGVVLYQMLTGELPGKRIEPPSRKVHLDVRLDEVVLRALDKEPARRYQQASQFKTQVEAIATSAGPETATAQSARPVLPPRLSRTAIVGAAWITCGPLAALLWSPLGASAAIGLRDNFGRSIVNAAIYLFTSLGAAAPFGATILGWIAVSHIRHSAGKLYGLGLALFDGLCFPLLALDAALLGITAIFVPVINRAPGTALKDEIFTTWGVAVVVLGLAPIAVIDWLICRAVWRAVKPPVNHQSTHPEKLATRIGGLEKKPFDWKHTWIWVGLCNALLAIDLFLWFATERGFPLSISIAAIFVVASVSVLSRRAWLSAGVGTALLAGGGALLFWMQYPRALDVPLTTESPDEHYQASAGTWRAMRVFGSDRLFYRFVVQGRGGNVFTSSEVPVPIGRLTSGVEARPIWDYTFNGHGRIHWEDNGAAVGFIVNGVEVWRYALQGDRFVPVGAAQQGPGTLVTLNEVPPVNAGASKSQPQPDYSQAFAPGATSVPAPAAPLRATNTATASALETAPILARDVTLNFADPTVTNAAFHSRQRPAFGLDTHDAGGWLVVVTTMLIGQSDFIVGLVCSPTGTQVEVKDLAGKSLVNATWNNRSERFEKLVNLPVDYGQKHCSCPVQLEFGRLSDKKLWGQYRFCAYLSGHVPLGGIERSFELVNVDRRLAFLRPAKEEKPADVLGIDINGNGTIEPGPDGGEIFNLDETFQIGAKHYRLIEANPSELKVAFQEVAEPDYVKAQDILKQAFGAAGALEETLKKKDDLRLAQNLASRVLEQLRTYNVLVHGTPVELAQTNLDWVASLASALQAGNWEAAGEEESGPGLKDDTEELDHLIALQRAESFGPVIERLLPFKPKAGTPYCLDVETSNLLAPPGHLTVVDSGWDQWCAQSGVDATAEQPKSGPVIWGQRSVFLKVENTRWGTIKPRRVVKELFLRGDVRGQADLPNRQAIPATFLFSTREGGHGVLQIIGFTDKPSGVKVRYKLVRSSKD